MKRNTILLLLFILLKFVLQYFAIDAGYELHRDEYLHLDLAKHLGWGYTSVPPVTAWISWIILHLGNSVFWVKFFPALFGALTTVFVWKTIEELKGNLFALLAGAMGVTFSVLIRINTLYQPNSLDFLFWTILFFSVIKYINSQNNKWLYYVSLSFAFGFLNKYNITFLLLGLLPAILITKQRVIFRNKHFYYSLILALIIILPNLIWQVKNDFPVFHHLKTLAETQLVNFSRINFLREQTLFFMGAQLIIILAFISFFIYKPFKKYMVFFWAYLFTILIFLYFKAKPYYAIGLYPALLAFGSVYIEKLLSKGWWRYLRPLVIITPVVVFIPLFQIILPVLNPEQIKQKADVFEKFGLLRWEDGNNHTLPQDFADMLGWKELAGLVDSTFAHIENKNNTLIICDNYGQAGAINFYKQLIYPDAVSMNADYIYWFPLDKMEVKNVILVKDIWDHDKNREEEKPFFDSVTQIGEIKNNNAREYGTAVYLLSGAKQPINGIIQQEILQKMNNN